MFNLRVKDKKVAAESPFEIWIIPKEHQASFDSISDKGKMDPAPLLHDLFDRLYQKLNNPDYNYIINSFSHFMRVDKIKSESSPPMSKQTGFYIFYG